MMLAGPGTDDVQRLQFLSGLAGMTHGLAVDGDVVQAQRERQGLDPALKAAQKRLGIETIEDAFKGVVRRDAVGQRQKSLEPVAPALAKGNDLLPIVGAADD